VIITGAGGGLGRSYALDLAKRGATVVVNDLGKDKKSGEYFADQVVTEIRMSGGNAVSNYDSALNGEKIISKTVELFGRVDAIINNAGVLRDKSFHNMSFEEWDIVLKVHLYATRNVCHAAWKQMRKQKYGRIVNITSVNGLYGQFGQTNYSAAKSGIIGLSKSLAMEGKKYDIRVNIVAPGAGGDSKMTKSVLPPDIYSRWLPKYVTPIVTLLTSDKCPCSGKIFEAGGGYFGEVKWHRSGGLFLPLESEFTPDEVLKNWGKITDFSKNTQYPDEERAKGKPGPQVWQIMDQIQSKL